MQNDCSSLNVSVCDSRNLSLDPDLLNSPFEIQTNWHVITGEICCGKTTLINLLADQGYQIHPEVSRQYIEEQVAKGRDIEELFASTLDERAITDLQRRAECGLIPAEITFLDRSLPDFLWFWRLLTMDPNELLVDCFRHRYASVFILDPLPLQMDGARIDDDAYTILFRQALVSDYSALGYDILRVPVMPPQERLEFVLERL
jgi:predicted ATPase